MSSNKKRKLLREGKLPESRTFTCEFCDMKFAHSDRLKRHRIVKHTKEYPFLCDQCPFGSTSKAELESHIKRHLFVDESSDHGGESHIDRHFVDATGKHSISSSFQRAVASCATSADWLSTTRRGSPATGSTRTPWSTTLKSTAAMSVVKASKTQWPYNITWNKSYVRLRKPIEKFNFIFSRRHYAQHCQPDEKSEKCEFCPRLVAANCKFGLQHYLSHHDDLSGNTQYLTAMNSRFGLRVHKGTGKFIRHHSQGDPSAETIIPGKLPIGLKVTEVEQNVFACPFCEEKFDTRREANIHTRKVVRILRLYTPHFLCLYDVRHPS